MRVIAATDSAIGCNTRILSTILLEFYCEYRFAAEISITAEFPEFDLPIEKPSPRIIIIALAAISPARAENNNDIDWNSCDQHSGT
jgi:hypothetical protein